MEHYLPLGPLDGQPIIDEFSYEEVKEGQCVATVSTNICHHLQNLTESDGSKYMCVCVPCYNEDLSELLKTLVSLLENFEFMEKKVSHKQYFPPVDVKSGFIHLYRRVCMTIVLVNHSAWNFDVPSQ